ncbi:uncharacterized protein BO97DRAFT_314907, partial [Aspergillus homomorphus CBS 101889]
SSLSLPVPNFPQDVAKRCLLLIYIHGFEGSEASFSDFPAHVHTSLTDLMGESHYIYTRIYPRYKSRGKMCTAVKNFNAWLSPHIADDLDVILLGHSLGGILATDVALLPSPPSPSSTNNPKKPRILGLVNFDVPFLGLHPHVIPTGIRAMLPHRTQDDDATATIAVKDPPAPGDCVYAAAALTAGPLFDPPFANDVHLVERDRIHGIIHFVRKNHHHNLPRSIYERFVSSYRFAGGLNNYVQLRRRYKQLMALEAAENGSRRVRFVNYYTLSTATHRKRSQGRAKRRERHAQRAPSPAPALSQIDASSDSLMNIDDGSDSSTCSQDCPPTTIQNIHSSSASSLSSSSSSSASTSKSRKFVLMPSHHWQNGDDSLWVPVQMENMDEVKAHQSMFLPHGRHYDQLVGEVVSQIERWVQDGLSERLIE